MKISADLDSPYHHPLSHYLELEDTETGRKITNCVQFDTDCGYYDVLEEAVFSDKLIQHRIWRKIDVRVPPSTPRGVLIDYYSKIHFILFP